MSANAGATTFQTPDGRVLTPAGFTIPVESFATSMALSPEGDWLAVLSQDDSAIDVIDSHSSGLVDRIPVPSATGMTWTTDGLYVTCGYTGTVLRFAYDAKNSKSSPELKRRADLQIGTVGLLNGILEDPATHRVMVARSADREVVIVDDRTDRVISTLKTSGQPFGLALAGTTLVATMYNSDRVNAWRNAGGDPVSIQTGPHPTAILAAGSKVFVSNADGHDVAVIDAASLRVVHRIDLGRTPGTPPGQTPSGMAVSDDGKMLFVAESGYNDVAIVSLAERRVLGRIPSGWYPTSILFRLRPAVKEKDPTARPQIWIESAKGIGGQSNTAGEDNDAYTGMVQHLVVEPRRFSEWTGQVARNDGFDRSARAQSLPPIKHVVFIVKENKHFDEEFGDEPAAHSDPALLLYGRKYTPNAHAMAETYALFDNFMGNGEASVYGHSWATQALANDYNERNAHSRGDTALTIPRVAYSIWPDSLGGDDKLSPSVMDFDWFRNLDQLPQGPRVNTSAIFGPRGELIDELRRRGKTFRVYGEQMTMLESGKIAPGLADHAARSYPGAHIDFATLDSTRAKLFLQDLRVHGLAQYTYMTLPTDHTAGSDPGFYTPASYVTNNDAALGEIIAGLSRRPEWRDTVVIVATDDPSGTGDHISGQRMPVYAVGPYVKRGFVDHTRYSLPSVLRTVEVLFGLQPLSIFDLAASPMTAAFASRPVVQTYHAIPSNFAMVKNPGEAASTSIELDGPQSAMIPDQEWASIYGLASLPWHAQYASNFFKETWGRNGLP
ncbi:MAG: alkaline phosphatase family protein [Vulcanimicrobiaceae bacterium]